MKIKVSLIIGAILLSGVGYQPSVVQAAGIADFVGGFFKKTDVQASPVTATASYTAEDLFAKIVELQTINPAAYDVNIKGKGFRVTGEVERITRLSAAARNNSGGITSGEFYAIKFKNCNISALFDLGKGQEVAEILIGQEISVIGRVGAAEKKEVLTVAIFDARIAKGPELLTPIPNPAGKK